LLLVAVRALIVVSRNRSKLIMMFSASRKLEHDSVVTLVSPRDRRKKGREWKN